MKAVWLNKKYVYNDFLAIALACIVSLLFTQSTHQFTTSKKLDQLSYYVDLASSNPAAISFSDKTHVPQHDIYYLFITPTTNFQYRILKNIVKREILQNGNQKIVAKNHYSCSLPPFSNPSRPIAYRKLII